MAAWLLASLCAARAAALAVQNIQLVRTDFEARLNESNRALAAREAELGMTKSSLDEARLKATAHSDTCIRLDTLRQSEQQVAAGRVQEIARLQSAVMHAEASKDVERSRAAALDADVARLTTVVEQERKAHERRMQT